MKPLILFYMTILSSTGGGQHAMSLLARELVKRGYDCVVFTRPPLRRKHRYVLWLSQIGVAIRALPRFDQLWLVRSGCLLSGLLLVLPYAVSRRCSFACAWQAANSIFHTLIARLERAYIRKQLTRYVRPGKTVVLHIWGPAALTPLLLEWAKTNGVPAIYHEMGEADEEYVKTWRLEPTVEAINRAQGLICCSPRVAENVRRVYGYKGEVATIPFMIEDPGAGWKCTRKHSGHITFGAIGRLVPHKRHKDLLYTLKRLCDYGYDTALVIAGDGPLRASLEDLATQLGVRNRVTFTGEFDQLEDVLAQFDVFVLTSASESQCMPITESMAYGKPVVASDFGGISDFVEDGVTGFLVPVGDVPKLTSTLKILLDHPSLCEKMGQRGRERYVERYTPQRIADAVEQVYSGLWTRYPAAGMRLGYVVECYATFVVKEILALRRLGAKVTVFNAFRPFPQRDPVKEALRHESLYFPPRYRGVVTANLRCLLRKPFTYVKLAACLRRRHESLRLLLLGAYYTHRMVQDGIQHLHATFAIRTTTLAYIMANLAGIDYSFTTHAYDIFTPNPLLVWKTNQARFMRTISEFNRRYLLENYAGIDPRKIRLVYLGVDTHAFAPNGSQAAKSPKVRILSVGTLIPQKGHLYLVRACRHLRERGFAFQCDIIGEGPLRQQLQREIQELGLQGLIRLRGEQPHAMVRHSLSQAHIFVLPCFDARDMGQHIDGIPVALMEAMAMGLATVSTNISGIPELIQDGVSGLLVPEKDERALAEALAGLIADKQWREALGRSGRRRIKEHFDLTTNTRQLVGMFKESL